MGRPVHRASSIFAALVIGAFSGARAAVETPLEAPSAARDLSRERVQLKIKTGDDDLDARVYALARGQFSDLMPLANAPPYTGAFEIVFTTAKQGLLGAKSPASADDRGDWFTGGHPASEPVHPGGGFLTWQTSAMTATLKNTDGAVIWKTTYHYNGGYELSGYTVHTPAQAAQLILKRVAARFAKDHSAFPAEK